MPEVTCGKTLGCFHKLKLYLVILLSTLSFLVGAPISSAHECTGSACNELFAYTCEEYFEVVGRPACKSLCNLDENQICEGFTGNFLADRTSENRPKKCVNGEYLDKEGGWRIHFEQYSDSTSLYFIMDITGPSHLLGEIETPSTFSKPSERFRYTVTIRPNWKLHYSFDLQMFSAEINRKGFEAISQEGNRDTDILDSDQYSGFREVDDDIFNSIKKFLKVDEFSTCEATRSLTRDKN